MPPPIKAAAAFGISYRPMTDEDLPFVARLFASTRAEEVAASGWPLAVQHAFLDRQHQAQHAHYRTAHPDGEWLIVERAGEAIGRLYLAEKEEALLLVDISLLPEARGGGLGSAIVADLLAQAARRNMAVSLHVLRGSPAGRLYRRLGFAPVGSIGVHERMEWRPGRHRP